MKRLLWLFALLLCALAQAAILPVVRGTITTQNLVPAGTCTANSCVEYGIETAGSVSVQVTGTYTGVLSIQVSTDGATWVTLGSASSLTRASTGATSATIGSGVQDTFQVGVAGYRRMRVTGLAAMTGTATVTIFGVETGGSSGGGSGGGGGGAVTVADGADVAQGATADAVCGTDTGTCSLVALLKKTNTDITATNTQLPSALGTATPAASLATTVPDGVLVSPASVTSATTIFTQDMLGYNSITVQVTSAGTATITYECSNDNTTFVACLGRDITATAGAGPTPTTTSTVTGAMIFPKWARSFRARVSSYTSGTVTVTYTLSQSSATGIMPMAGVVSSSGFFIAVGNSSNNAALSGNGIRTGAVARTSNYAANTSGNYADAIATTVGAIVVRPYSIPEGEWQFASATGGIANTTTAVTVKAAAGAGIKNYITGLCLQTATLGGATEFAIRDGAAGTVIWRTQLQTTAMPLSCHTFNTPLQGTANTLVEIVTLTAVTGGVFANLQGYSAP